LLFHEIPPFPAGYEPCRGKGRKEEKVKLISVFLRGPLHDLSDLCGNFFKPQSTQGRRKARKELR